MKRVIITLLAITAITAVDARAGNFLSAYFDGDLQAMLNVIEAPEIVTTADGTTVTTVTRNADWFRLLLGMLPVASMFALAIPMHESRKKDIAQ
ncbi:MAG: hypothetical protein NC098_09100 [Lachnoclostridium sp.]|nr:hypothetical protein [Lachnoclostridium sp.]